MSTDSAAQKSSGSSGSTAKIIRLVILLGILAVALGAFYMDRQARNEMEEAYAKIGSRLPGEDDVPEADPQPTTVAKVHEMLGREPTRKEELPQFRLVEYYTYPGTFHLYELELHYRGSVAELHLEVAEKGSRWRFGG